MSALAAMRTRVPRIDVRVATLLGVTGLVAAVIGVVVTRHGLGLRSDSAVYLGTAHNLLHGRGATSPITLTFTDAFSPDAAVGFHGALPQTALPPLYSFALAAIGVFGLSLETAARVLGVACLTVATMLVTWLALRLTGAWLVALGAGAVFLGGGALTQGALLLPGSWIVLSASVLSEALFLVLVLVTVVALAGLLERGTRAALWTTGVLVGLAILCRYLGVALLVTAVLMILARAGWSWATRVRRAAVVSALGVAPVLIWMALLRALVGHGQALPAKYHHFSYADLRDGVTNIAHWFVPSSVGNGPAVAVLVVVVALVAVMAWPGLRGGLTARDQRERADHEADRLLAVLAVFVVVYLVCVFGSHLVLARNVSFDVRFLAIVRPLVYVLVAVVVYRFLSRFGTAVAAGAVAALCAVLVGVFAGPVDTLVRAGVALPLPSGPTVDAVKHLPRHALIFSNAVETLWAVDDRDAVLFPVRYVTESDSFNPHLARDVDQVGRLLRRPDSYVVLFKESSGTFAPIADLERVAPLEVVGSYGDGTIYQLRHS